MLFNRIFLKPQFWSAWLALLPVMTARAQWTAETYRLEGGWNGIWLPHDCSHADLSTLLEGQGDILEVWQWNPLGSTAQFTTSPWIPQQPDAAWKVWKREDPGTSTLSTMTGNAAYLVRVAEGRAAYTFTLTGKPLLPRYEFSTTGSNLVGFPVQEPASVTSRSFERFFSWSEVFKSNPPVFYYRNGPASAQFPVQALPRTTAVDRNRAYWVRNDVYADYYGPVKISMTGAGLDFGPDRNVISLRLKNVVDPARNQTIGVTLKPAASASPPAGHAASAGPVPLLVRGLRDAQTLEFAWSPVAEAGHTLTLSPGQEVEVTLAVDRAAMGGSPGSVFQSLLNVTDSLEQTRVPLAVRAATTSHTGLWAGAAAVNMVDQIIGQQKTPDANAPAPFPLRLLVHRTASGTTTLLQQVYLADRNGTALAGVTEAGIKSQSTGPLSRLSAVNFPLSLAQPGTGQLAAAGQVTFQVDSGYNSASSPFVHAYHPDHDNLDARFENVLPEGRESFTVRRSVSLRFLPTVTGGAGPGWGSTSIGGTYTETVTGLRTVPVVITGSFILHRVSTAAELIP